MGQISPPLTRLDAPEDPRLASSNPEQLLAEGTTVRLEFVGGESGNTGSPRVYKTDRDTLVIQGYKVEDAEALADANTPAHETLVEIPYSLLQYLPRD